jgi:hypothetical protein
MAITVRLRINSSSASRIALSDAESRADVASSSSKIGASFRKALAMAIH